MKGRARMLSMFIINLFLYFPEDKSEYIPAAISFSIFFVFCVLTFLFILKVSKKESEEAKQLEEKLRRENIIQD